MAVSQAIGKQPGDSVHIELVKLEEPRIVVVPEDLQKLLQQHPDALQVFNGLLFAHLWECVNWINDAKKKDTRQRRMEKHLQMLMEKKHFENLLQTGNPVCDASYPARGGRINL
jgi:hypothetical protein